MKSFAEKSLFTVILFFGGAIGLAAAETKADTKASSVTFREVEYFYRWSQDDQHEFTPRGQEDLEHWAEMVTFNRYRSVKDGEGLAAVANAVLENYKKSRGIIVRTDSVPRTADKPAEYLVVVLFPQPALIEAAFARFRIVDGMGTSTVYSHRKYGKQAGDQMSAWLKANGPETEKALMSWAEIPSVEPAKK